MSCARRNVTPRHASSFGSSLLAWSELLYPACEERRKRPRSVRGLPMDAIEQQSSRASGAAAAWGKWPATYHTCWLVMVLIWSGTRRRRRRTSGGSTLRTLQCVVSLRAFGSVKADQSYSRKQILLLLAWRDSVLGPGAELGPGGLWSILRFGKKIVPSPYRLYWPSGDID
jgi:hypothetical protein